MKQEELKSRMLLIAFGIALYTVSANLPAILSGLRYIGGVVSPIIGGMILGFVLHVPVKAFDRLWNRLFRKHPLKRSVGTVLSVSLTLLLLSALLYLVYILVIPELAASLKTLRMYLAEKLPVWLDTIREHGLSIPDLSNWTAVEGTEQKEVLENMSGRLGSMLSSLAGVASSTVAGISNAGVAAVVAIYVLFSRDRISRQSSKLLYACIRPPAADKIHEVGRLICDTYERFFSGQCLEAVILGAIMSLAFHLFRLPNAALVGFLAGALSFLPYVGAFFSFAFAALMTVLASPEQLPLCILVYSGVQLMENHMIYPHVVGSSVGLAPFWTLCAVLVGGKLFGVPGMLFFIPLTSVLYTLIVKAIDRRLEQNRSCREEKCRT